MSFSVMPQCAVDELHDSRYCFKRHFVRQELSIFERSFVHFDPIFGSALTRYECPTLDASTVRFTALFEASFVLSTFQIWRQKLLALPL